MVTVVFSEGAGPLLRQPASNESVKRTLAVHPWIMQRFVVVMKYSSQFAQFGSSTTLLVSSADHRMSDSTLCRPFYDDRIVALAGAYSVFADPQCATMLC